MTNIFEHEQILGICPDDALRLVCTAAILTCRLFQEPSVSSLVE